MTKPKWAQSTPHGRVYRFPDDPQDYPSITTLINMLSKDALKYWAARVVAENAVQKQQVWGDMPPDDAINYLKGTPFTYTKEKADYGSMIHDLLETGTPSELPRIGVAAAAIGDLFGEHYGSELTVINRELNYAGTADVYTYLPDGRFCVADWKTGNVGYDSHAFQLAMLAMCTHVVTEDSEQIALPEPPDVGLAIGLKDNGYKALELDLSDFSLARWRKPIAGLRELWELRKWWGRDGQWTDEYNRRVN